MLHDIKIDRDEKKYIKFLYCFCVEHSPYQWSIINNFLFFLCPVFVFIVFPLAFMFSCSFFELQTLIKWFFRFRTMAWNYSFILWWFWGFAVEPFIARLSSFFSFFATTAFCCLQACFLFVCTKIRFNYVF